MKSKTTNGIIMLKDDFGIEYKIADIEYIIKEDDSFEYIFRPFYSVIDFLMPPLFQGIPGLDLSLRKEMYIRKNEIPVFISERTPSKNRVDLPELLDEAGMKYLNQLEWLIKTNTLYSGDKLYVISVEDFESKRNTLLQEKTSVKKSSDNVRCVLSRIGLGINNVLKDIEIQEKSKPDIYALFTTILKEDTERIKLNRKDGIKNAIKQGKYKGRTKISIDTPLLEDIYKKYTLGKITADEAAKKCGVSRATFFRRVKLLTSKVN